jgi:hypothetical protein
MPLFEIKLGTTRRVILTKGFVIKTPAYLPFCGEHEYLIYHEGVLANLAERVISRQTEDLPFCAPVLISLLGIVNIQRRIRGVAPTRQQLLAPMSQFSKDLAQDWGCVGSHQWDEENFVIDESGKWWCVDFGGATLHETIPLFPVLFNNRRELCKLFGHELKESAIGRLIDL